MLTDLLVVVLGSGATVAVAMTVTAVASRRAGRVSVVDTAWGLAFVAVALACAVLAHVLDTGAAPLSWLLVVVISAWGLRLSWHMHRRNHGAGEDPRYAEMLGDASFATVVLKVFVVQGLAVWLVSLPVQLAAVAGSGPVWPVVVAGVVLCVTGVAFEAVGDAQLSAYKRRDDRPPVMDTGLWRYTRHPNYFGDACLWWGVWLVAAAAAWWVAPASVLAPVAMSYFLVHATGARLLEETMRKRPGYPAYAARTSMFLPLPPRDGAGADDPARGALG